MKRLFVFGLFALLSTAGVRAFRPIAAPTEGPAANIALGGYDPMGYWTEGKPIEGSPLLFAEWRGATWYFHSQENRRRFVANPEHYAPAFGGYCAFCVAESGAEATSGDPQVFLIHKDRLYILQSEEVKQQWLKDPDTYAARAERVYTGLLAEVAVD